MYSYSGTVPGSLAGIKVELYRLDDDTRVFQTVSGRGGRFTVTVAGYGEYYLRYSGKGTSHLRDQLVTIGIEHVATMFNNVFEVFDDAGTLKLRLKANLYDIGGGLIVTAGQEYEDTTAS